jgi:hypothetical protein
VNQGCLEEEIHEGSEILLGMCLLVEMQEEDFAV